MSWALRGGQTSRPSNPAFMPTKSKHTTCDRSKSVSRSPSTTSELSSSEDDLANLTPKAPVTSVRERHVSCTQSPTVSPRKRQAYGEDCASGSVRSKPGSHARKARQPARPLDTTSYFSSGSSSEEETQGDEYVDGSENAKKKRGSLKAKKSSNMTNGAVARAKKREKEVFGFALMGDEEENDDDAIRQSQDNNRAVVEEMERHLFMSASSQTGSSDAEVPSQAGKLTSCPFCFEPMPRPLSSELEEMMQYWLDQYHQKRRIGSTATLEACQRHRNEAKTIPEGKKRGWISKLEEEKLVRRVRNERNPFVSIMRQRVIEPTSSDWYKAVVEARQRYGKQAESNSAQMQNLNEMQAGYYGEKGWELLRKTLVEDFVTNASPEHDLNQLATHPDRPLKLLGQSGFVERVLLPELICLLIIDNEKAKRGKISMEQAKSIRDESTDYGIAMFPSNAIGKLKTGLGAKKHSVFSVDDDDSGRKDSQERKKTAGKAIPIPAPGSGRRSPGKSGIWRRKETGEKERRQNGSRASPPPASQPIAGRPRPRPSASRSSELQSSLDEAFGAAASTHSGVKGSGESTTTGGPTPGASLDWLSDPPSLDSSLPSSADTLP